MDNTFIEDLMEKHRQTPEVPSSKTVSAWAEGLMEILFPEVSEQRLGSISEINEALEDLKEGLVTMLQKTKACKQGDCTKNATTFFTALPNIYNDLLLDITAFVDGDPAANSSFEVVRAYPGFYALFIHRIAHQLHQLQIPLIPRILAEYAHSKSGVDIHPAASIGKSFFIDHGTGVVIGETTVIGDHVKIYQGVTLGAISIDKKMTGIKRHPTVENNVVIYSGATILGGDTVIGAGCIIGGNVWLTKSVPAGTRVYHNADNKYVERIGLKAI
jgi:serine O-acetyltransferase